MLEHTARPEARWMPWALAGIVLAALIGVAFGVWRTIETANRAPVLGNPPAIANATQTNEGGQVTVIVAWAGPTTGPQFTVTLDTHAVDLDGYDLGQLAVLRTDQGRELQAIGWDAPNGGHHRKGTLTFPVTTPDGSTLFTPETRQIELILRDISGVPERRFRWTW